MMRMYRCGLVALLAGLLVTAATAAEWIKLPPTRDVWLSAVGEEVDDSMGKTDQLKLKVWQEFAIVDFDVSPAKGKRITAAELWIHPLGAAVVGQDRGTDLNWITVSTVSADWVEGDAAKSYEKDTKGHGATFNEASFQSRSWAGPGSKVYDVILGNDNSLRYDGRLEKVGPSGATVSGEGGAGEAGWYKMTIPVGLVEVLLAGGSHGLFIMDGSTSPGQNNFVSSRESGKGPFLHVELREADTAAPQPVRGLTVGPAPHAAKPGHGALAVRLEGPADAAALQVRIDGEALARWQIPQPRKSGGAQEFAIVDLPADKEVKVEVAAADGAGNVSAVASASGRTSKALSVEPLPASAWKPAGGPPKVSAGKLGVWALPAIVKVEPVSGRVLGETVAGEYQQANAVWDGKDGLIRLVAARGDIVSCQLTIQALQEKLSGVRVGVSPLRGGGGQIPGRDIRLYRNWYVAAAGGWHSEYATPLGEGFDIPTKDNGIKDQRLQGVTIDVVVPPTATAGPYEGTVTVQAQGAEPIKLGLRVEVHDVVIPDELNFNPELNCYDGPGRAGSEPFFEAHRLAHYHRCTINRVPYHQNGVVHVDMIPKVSGAGKAIRVADWSQYDRDLGPILDGSAFRGNPRDGVPVRTFYVPFFENWPTNIQEHYRPDAPTSGPEWRMRHDMLAKPIDQAFDQAYKDAMVAITRQFVEHYEQKGYTRTLVEMYLNNKPNAQRMVSTAWTLDEPVCYLDWAALRFFSELYHEGIRGQKGTHFVFRGDISRAEWQGSVMDGVMEIMYANSGQFQMPEVVAGWKRRNGSILYCYGSCNPLVRQDEPVSNYESAAWCLQAYSQECDGVLPWQSLSGEQALTKPDTNGLLVEGKPFGVAWVASYRVFALREGAELVELMRQVAAARGWTRAQMGLLASQKLPLGAQFRQRFADEAAAVEYGQISADGFVQLREALLTMLSQR